MEAPVPASSLIHSATLVSAGIYLLLKFYTIFVLTDLVNVIFFIGSFTACYGGVVAASQSDMKKLLAYSTISHCGFIVASISLNNLLITVVYLYLHGLFKALTFFCAGSVIKFNGTQDSRLMGMNKNQIVNIITLTVASINLGGLPFTFGYLYKFLFLNYLMISPFNFISYGLNIIGMLCSIVYVFKLIYYSCFDYRKGSYQILTTLVQNNKNSLKCLVFNFTFFKIIAFSIIYIFSCSFFFLIKFFFLKNYYFIFYSGSFETNNFIYLSELFFSSSHLMSIFYIFFVLTIITLILINGRENEFFIERVNLLIQLLGVITFFNGCNYFIVKINLIINMFNL
jgi:NADH:ubiquinone oxidoreductase subunit 5 (subunit L)/multisubunit Na+/H+ antiporter MnhA subunit